MTPHEFLHVLVDALVERLQERDCVGLPGIGRLRPDGSVPGGVEFVPGDGPDLDVAVMSLAEAISRRTGHDVASAAVGLSRFSASVRRFMEEHGTLEIPGIGHFHGQSDTPGFTPSAELEVALGRDPSATRAPDPMERKSSLGETSGVDSQMPSSEPQDLSPEVVDAVIEHANLPPLRPPSSRMRRPERRRPGIALSPVLIGAMAVVIVLVVLFVLVSRRSAPVPSAVPGASDSSSTVAASGVGARPDSASGTRSDSTLASRVVTNPTVGQLPITEAPPAAAQPVRPDPVATRNAPATGSGDFDTTRPGFTLITASTTSVDEAQRSAGLVRSFGHPVAVLAYVEDGTTRFRVGLGIFPSLAQADSVRLSLAARLPTGTWIRRIRP